MGKKYDDGAYAALACFSKRADAAAPAPPVRVNPPPVTGTGAHPVSSPTHPMAAQVANSLVGGATGAVINTIMAAPGDRVRQGTISFLSEAVGSALGPWGMMASPLINMGLQHFTAPKGEEKQADHADDRLKERIKTEFPPDALAKLRAQAKDLELAPGRYYLPMKDKAGNTAAIAAFKTVGPKDQLVLATVLAPKKNPPSGTSLSHLMKQPMGAQVAKVDASPKQYTIRKNPEGRYTCTCKNFKFVHRAAGTNCKHIDEHLGSTKESANKLEQFLLNQGSISAPQRAELRKQFGRTTVSPGVRSKALASQALALEPGAMKDTSLRALRGLMQTPHYPDQKSLERTRRFNELSLTPKLKQMRGKSLDASYWKDKDPTFFYDEKKQFATPGEYQAKSMRLGEEPAPTGLRAEHVLRAAAARKPIDTKLSPEQGRLVMYPDALKIQRERLNKQRSTRDQTKPWDPSEMRQMLEHEGGERSMVLEGVRRGKATAPYSSHWGSDADVAANLVAAKDPKSTWTPDNPDSFIEQKHFGRLYKQMGGTRGSPIPVDSRQSRALSRRIGDVMAQAPINEETRYDLASALEGGIAGMPLHPKLEQRLMRDYSLLRPEEAVAPSVDPANKSQAALEVLKKRTRMKTSELDAKEAANKLETMLRGGKLLPATMARVPALPETAAGMPAFRRTMNTPTFSKTEVDRYNELSRLLLPSQAKARGVKLTTGPELQDAFGITVPATHENAVPPQTKIRAEGERLGLGVPKQVDLSSRPEIYIHPNAGEYSRAKDLARTLGVDPSYPAFTSPDQLQGFLAKKQPVSAGAPRETDPVFTRATLEHEVGEREALTRAARAITEKNPEHGSVTYGTHYGPEAHVREFAAAARNPDVWRMSTETGLYPEESVGEKNLMRLYRQVGGTQGSPISPNSRRAEALRRRLANILASTPGGHHDLRESALTGLQGVPLHPELEKRVLPNLAAFTKTSANLLPSLQRKNRNNLEAEPDKAEETPQEKPKSWLAPALVAGAGLAAGVGAYKYMKTPSYSVTPSFRRVQEHAATHGFHPIVDVANHPAPAWDKSEGVINNLWYQAQHAMRPQVTPEGDFSALNRFKLWSQYGKGAIPVANVNGRQVIPGHEGPVNLTGVVHHRHETSPGLQVPWRDLVHGGIDLEGDPTTQHAMGQLDKGKGREFAFWNKHVPGLMPQTEGDVSKYFPPNHQELAATPEGRVALVRKIQKNMRKHFGTREGNNTDFLLKPDVGLLSQGQLPFGDKDWGKQLESYEKHMANPANAAEHAKAINSSDMDQMYYLNSHGFKDGHTLVEGHTLRHMLNNPKNGVILQRKIPDYDQAHEYRVHTIHGQVPKSLIVPRFQSETPKNILRNQAGVPGVGDVDYEEIQRQVLHALSKLPPEHQRGMFGLDAHFNPKTNKLHLLESNPTARAGWEGGLYNSGGQSGLLEAENIPWAGHAMHRTVTGVHTTPAALAGALPAAGLAAGVTGLGAHLLTSNGRRKDEEEEDAPYPN